MQADASPVVKYEKIKRSDLRYDGDPYIAMIERIRTPLSCPTRGGGRGRQGKRKKKCIFRLTLTFCHTKTLWTMAHPQNTMPRPMKTDVTIAGVEWNWMNVYRIMPADHNVSYTQAGLINHVMPITIYEANKFVSRCVFRI